MKLRATTQLAHEKSKTRRDSEHGSRKGDLKGLRSHRIALALASCWKRTRGIAGANSLAVASRSNSTGEGSTRRRSVRPRSTCLDRGPKGQKRVPLDSDNEVYPHSSHQSSSLKLQRLHKCDVPKSEKVGERTVRKKNIERSLQEGDRLRTRQCSTSCPKGVASRKNQRRS